jgi:hypothetical protein
MLKKISGFLFVLLLAAIMPAAVFAEDGSTSPQTNNVAERAITLSAATPKMSGQLLPNGNQAVFMYYAIPYTGNNQELALTVTFDGATNGGFANREVGFNLYSANGKLVAHRDGVKRSGRQWTARCTVASTVNQTYLLQVYNYSPNKSTCFDLTVSGLK